MKQSEKVVPLKTKREITCGRAWKLHKQYRRISILDKELKRHFLNCMLDAVVTQHDHAQNQRNKKVEKDVE